MLKCGRMQNKILSNLVCSSHGACLDCMLPGAQVTTGLGFCSVFKVIYVIVKIVTPCFTDLAFLAGP